MSGGNVRIPLVAWKAMPIGPEVRNRGSSSGQSHVPLFLGYLWKWFYKDQRHMTSYTVRITVGSRQGQECSDRDHRQQQLRPRVYHRGQWCNSREERTPL